MNFNNRELQMFEVMRAFYESDIPVDFKGSMVLKALLNECGYSDSIRQTTDIDANWYSDSAPSKDLIIGSIQEILDKNNIPLNVSMYRMYGEGKSAGFDFTDPLTGDVVFTMDMDVNRPIPQTRIYEINDIRFKGVSPVQMIADKLYVISSDKVFRRIKDIVDLYYISTVFDFDRSAVSAALKNSGRNLDDFDGFLNRKDDLRHAYDLFRFGGNIYKPPFDEVYNAAKDFIKPMLSKTLSKRRNKDKDIVR